MVVQSAVELAFVVAPGVVAAAAAVVVAAPAVVAVPAHLQVQKAAEELEGKDLVDSYYYLAALLQVFHVSPPQLLLELPSYLFL